MSSQLVLGLRILSFFCVLIINLRANLQPLESFNYDPNYRDISLITKQPYAVCVVAFNRPDHLARVIKSLENNPESFWIPFYFFLDGGPDGQQEKNSNIINASTIKNKTIITRDHNYGCPKNHIDAKRFMFDWCGFEKVIVLEEDLIVSPSFIHLNLTLHAWAKKKFSNVGVVQCWSYCYLTKKEKQLFLNQVSADCNPWWSFVGYCIDKEVWDTMSCFLYEYELFINQIPHTDHYQRERSKPGTSDIGPIIHNWIKTIALKHPPLLKQPGKEIFPNNAKHTIKRWCFSDKFQPNQDMMTGLALMMAGYIKIGTIVNRARHIGHDGITCNQKIFDKKFKRIRLDTFTEIDENLCTFVLHKKKPTRPFFKKSHS
jgi:hypothetical protein